ncbi:MAG: PadR family transcriptional regulator [Bryobacteraceae bacterium]
MGRKAQKNDSLPGSLDMLILKTLTREHLHGYAIVQKIRQASDDQILIEEGSLYPALQRLELNGWIAGEWGVTPANRRARIYKLTPKGRKQLTRETHRYAQLTLAISRVMAAE